jgi:hypothetical protein
MDPESTVIDAKIAESSKSYPGAILLGPRIIAKDSRLLSAKFAQDSLFAILACPSGEPTEILRRSVLGKNA